MSSQHRLHQQCVEDRGQVCGALIDTRRVSPISVLAANGYIEVALLAGFDERSVMNVTRLVEPAPASASSAITLGHLGGEVPSNVSCKGTASGQELGRQRPWSGKELFKVSPRITPLY